MYLHALNYTKFRKSLIERNPENINSAFISNLHARSLSNLNSFCSPNLNINYKKLLTIDLSQFCYRCIKILSITHLLKKISFMTKTQSCPKKNLKKCANTGRATLYKKLPFKIKYTENYLRIPIALFHALNFVL